ncbi:uncharacterized protein LOC101854909 [Aplysia californica]|uniref:Uncharacterized protein LOC101854909 n=1 Tax=Aplysia californica TaxID=6500 RepID=A0ABM1AB56_APLCA|nr:uncharacterized protein LOC101854909 [Aplysia californica]XP_005089050.1 uncharacterized protein LOC101854909 [Aplysia californica]XP_005089051.1 uncharacterized protein LOC101854909 [Aplysia californica]XP_005089052.1 uncharacterized protein LOC101854909 [Aplysia californica]XP_005089053.1 uncharacterized protein LOC101854909 [Aplysia californica]XP_005089054.1 uncharacterized protein LOC101854909 [Aplysia californica]XP_005089055.1 uncharacterized protein LOC101854909 [Aplysia californic
MRVLAWRRPRLFSGHCWRVVRLVLLLSMLFVLLVVPVRNAVLSFFLPGMWLEHSTLFLIKVALDFQHFPVEDAPLGHSPIRLQVDESEIQLKYLPRAPSFQEFYQQVSHLEQRARSSSAAQRELDTLLMFEPVMNPKERATALFTMDVFIRACKAANLTFFLISGSMMGVMRHHGMIPWDDDFDVAMNGSDWRKVRDVLSNIEGFELFAPAKVQWKFFLSSLPKGNRPFKWPNIDIFFFNEDEEFVWSQTWGGKYSLCNKKSDVFPLVVRKFELWSVPVPRRIGALLTAEFGDFHSECSTPAYSHKINVEVDSDMQKMVKCDKLHKVFPFVFHKAGSSSKTVLEIKMVGGHPISNATFPVE